MVSQTVNKILEAEKQASAKTDSALEKSEQIIYEANMKAQDIINASRQEIEAETERLINDNKEEILKISNDTKKKALAEASEIRAKAEAKKAEAMDIVINRIIPK